MKVWSTILFRTRKPSLYWAFLRGTGSVLNEWPDTKPLQTRAMFLQSDNEALKADWGRVGQDIGTAVFSLKGEVNSRYCAHVEET